MCVIIYKKPGIVIPKEKIISACKVNSDGFGFSYLKDNTLITQKGYNKNGNDPDEVYELMERNNDYPQYIHLRFTTRGESNLDNCHPFPLIENKEDTIMFMHNGTLTSFGNATQSDTKDFANRLLKPLFESYYTNFGDDLWTQESLENIIEKFTGNGIFLIYDNKGNVANFGTDNSRNGNTWHDDKGWWSSNVYSFNRDHREKTSNYYYSNSNGNTTYKPYGGTQTTSPFPDQKHPQLVYDSQKVNGKDSEEKAIIIKKDGQSFGFALSEAKRKGLEYFRQLENQDNRLSFKDLTQIGDILDLAVLSEEDIVDLVLDCPELSSVIILDLIEEVYNLRKLLEEKTKPSTEESKAA
jgi:hypothetical protein